LHDEAATATLFAELSAGLLATKLLKKSLTSSQDDPSIVGAPSFSPLSLADAAALLDFFDGRRSATDAARLLATALVKN